MQYLLFYAKLKSTNISSDLTYTDEFSHFQVTFSKNEHRSIVKCDMTLEIYLLSMK